MWWAGRRKIADTGPDQGGGWVMDWGWPQWVMLVGVVIGAINDIRKTRRDATNASITFSVTWLVVAWVLWMGGFWS